MNNDPANNKHLNGTDGKLEAEKEVSYKYYSLRIWVKKENYHKIDEILGVKSSSAPSIWWTLQYTEREEDDPIPYIKKFTSILNGKYEQLAEIGIQRDDISVWEEYAYDAQCNMEFSPEEMYALGKEGITLCVSCWDIRDYSKDKE